MKDSSFKTRNSSLGSCQTKKTNKQNVKCLSVREGKSNNSKQPEEIIMKHLGEQFNTGFLMDALRGCGQTPLPQNHLGKRMTQHCIQINGITCVRAQWAAGNPGWNANHQCHFFIYIALGCRWWLKTLKVNLLLQESQYFAITLGRDLNSRQPIYFFTHVYISIHCHQYLGAEWFHEAPSFETESSQSNSLCFIRKTKRLEESSLNFKTAYLLLLPPPLLSHFPLSSERMFHF